jgi:large subunit ribosomal protein L32
MPPLPKRKINKSARDRRRSHLALKKANLTECPQCHQLRLPHTACPHCGSYKGVEVYKVESKKKE